MSRMTNGDNDNVTRETLLIRVRRQYDQQAWTEFIFAYRGYVYGIARRMGLQHHDAEEVAQAVMLTCWDKLPEFTYDAGRGRFRGWLCTVAGNEVKMLIRRRRQGLEQVDTGDTAAVEGYLDQLQVNPTEELAEREWVAYVTKLAWERLRGTVGEKECAAFEQLSRGDGPETVAQALGLTVSSVYVYKKRVQDRLRQIVLQLNRDLD